MAGVTAAATSLHPACDALDRRIEEAGLNNLHTRRQLFYDGWLLFLSPGRAKRARSVNAHFGSTLPLATKIERCERVYRRHRLPLLFRVTPFAQPPALDDALEARGYLRFDETLVQRCELGLPQRFAPANVAHPASPLAIEPAGVPAYVDAIGDFRGSPAAQRSAHLERLEQSPLDVRPVVAREGGAVVGGGIVSIDEDLAGLFDVFTATEAQGRGVATAVTSALLAQAAAAGARNAYLQVSRDNAAALAVYGKFGFVTRYRYHYRAREGDVE
jgi:ribosomal protein S18 acetylase RimI-like enzyme